MPSMRNDIWAAPCGDAGVGTIAEVASKRRCTVKLLGQSLMERDFERQFAEIQIRIAVLNRYTALGIPITEPAG